MKIGFSSRVCPGWDLAAMIGKAAELGFEGIEIETSAMRGASGDADSFRHALAEKKVELVCLGWTGKLESAGLSANGAARVQLMEMVESAGRLGCSFVRAPLGAVRKGGDRYGTLADISRSLAEIAPEIARRRVTLLVENGGDFASSRDVWFVVDAVSHPAVAACWDPCVGMTMLERSTLSIPRLGKKIRLVHVCDGAFDDRGRFGGYKLPGEGDVGLGRMIDLLRGIIYRGYLMFDWPKAAAAELPGPDDALPKVKAWLAERIADLAEPLTAYKGDKQAVRFKGMAAPVAAKPAKAKH